MKIKILLLLFLLFTSYFSYFRFVKIKSVSCQSTFGPCSKSVADVVASLPGKNIKNGKSELQKSLAENPQVEEYSIRIIFPDKLSLYVKEKKPEIAVKKSYDDKFMLVDLDGNTLTETEQSPLPKLLLNEDLKDDEYKFAISLLKQLFLVYGVKESHYSEHEITATIKKYQVIFPVRGDLDVILGSLELVFSQLNRGEGVIRIENGETLIPKTIDLRFENAVLR